MVRSDAGSATNSSGKGSPCDGTISSQCTQLLITDTTTRETSKILTDSHADLCACLHSVRRVSYLLSTFPGQTSQPQACPHNPTTLPSCTVSHASI